MGLIDNAIETAVAIFLIIMFFGALSASMSEATGLHIGFFWLKG